MGFNRQFTKSTESGSGKRIIVDFVIYFGVACVDEFDASNEVF